MGPAISDGDYRACEIRLRSATPVIEILIERIERDCYADPKRCHSKVTPKQTTRARPFAPCKLQGPNCQEAAPAALGSLPEAWAKSRVAKFQEEI